MEISDIFELKNNECSSSFVYDCPSKVSRQIISDFYKVNCTKVIRAFYRKKFGFFNSSVRDSIILDGRELFIGRKIILDIGGLVRECSEKSLINNYLGGINDIYLQFFTNSIEVKRIFESFGGSNILTYKF